MGDFGQFGMPERIRYKRIRFLCSPEGLILHLLLVSPLSTHLSQFRTLDLMRLLGWYNNYSLGVAGPIIVDGAKRDR